MKILHISPSYWPAFEFGGPIQSVHLLNRYLVKEGVDVTVYTTNAGLEKEKIKLETIQYIDGVRVVYFPYFGSKNYNFSLSLFYVLLKTLKNFDLVHITGVWNFPVFVGGVLSRLYKKPYIISPRGSLYPETFKGRSKFKYFKKLINYHLVLKKTIKSVWAFHFTTLDEAEKTINFLNLDNDYFVVPNGLDLRQIKKETPEKGYFKKKFSIKKDYILILGRLSWKKGFDILIPAFAKIKEKFSDLVLVVSGPDQENYKKQIEDWARKYKVEKDIIFTGLLEGKDKWGAYLDAEVFVLPSYSENFGMVVVEAMACGVPVVISEKVGIFKEVKESEAGLVVSLDIDKVSKAISELLENRSLKEKISKNAKKLIEEKYNIKEVARKMKLEYIKTIREGEYY